MNKNTDYSGYFNNILLNFVENYSIPAEKLKQALKYTLFPGGKRLRPLLVYYTGEILNIKLQILNPIAIAIELIHTYSLLHDDLPAMDNDDIRRGQPSCHRKFDEATAILLGDGLQPLAIEILSSLKDFLPAQNVLAIIDCLIKAAGFKGMVSGQSLDLTELKINKTVTSDELAKIHNLKTASLIHACINMVIKSSAEYCEQNYAALEEFAKNFGLLFQIQDDYLDKYKINVLKKGRNSDTVNQKITFASLYNKDELIELINIYQQKTIAALNKTNANTKSMQHFINTINKRIYTN